MNDEFQTMGMRRISVLLYQCERCGHEWQARKKSRPRVCGKCKSAYWDVPRKKPMASPKRNE